MYRRAWRLLQFFDRPSNGDGGAWKDTKTSTKEKGPQTTMVASLDPTGSSSDIARQITGVDFDPNEHALLCDLDEGRDAALYGTGKEFYENMKRIRTIIITHHKWKLSERMYHALTVCAQIWVVIVLYITWQAHQTLAVLMESKDAFAEIVHSRIDGMRQERLADAAKSVAILDLGAATPKGLEDTAIQIRRAMLPTSEDYHATVRARMKRYHEEKHEKLAHPE